MINEPEEHFATEHESNFLHKISEEDTELFVSGHLPKEEETANDNIKKTDKRKKIIWKIIAVIAVIVLAVLVFVYSQPSSDSRVKAIASAVPFPAFLVGRTPISFGQYYAERASLEKYFSSSEELKKNIPAKDAFNKMIVDSLVNKTMVVKFASDLGVQIDQNRVETFYNNIAKTDQGGGDAFAKQLNDTFGWSPVLFKDRVVEPVVLALQVGDAILANNDIQKPQRMMIDAARARVESGEDFVTVGKEVHEKAKMTLQSDLGDINISELPETWGPQVNALELNKVSDVIELPEGMAIFKVTERKKVKDQDQIHLLVITVPKITLQQMIESYLKNVSVKTLIRM